MMCDEDMLLTISKVASFQGVVLKHKIINVVHKNCSNESTKGADASVYVYCSTKLTKRD